MNTCSASESYHPRRVNQPNIITTIHGAVHVTISTANVEKQRAEGKLVGTIKGISRSREEEVLRVRNFSVFSLAGGK